MPHSPELTPPAPAGVAHDPLHPPSSHLDPRMPESELERMRRHLAALEAEVVRLRERADPGSLRGEAARIVEEIDDTHSGTDPFAAAVRTTRMPMVIADPRRPDTPIVFVNDAFCRLAGYEREEIVGRNCRFLQGPDTDPATVREIGDAVRAELPVKADILNYRKDGEPFWNRLLMAPVRNAAGDITYFFASQVDVTDERRRLEELEGDKATLSAEVAKTLRNQQKVENQLRRLNDTLEQRVAARTRDLDRMWRNAQDLLVVTDMGGTLLAVNPATALLLGRSRHEMVGANVLSFVHADDHPPLVDGALDPDMYGRRRHVTNRCLHADGSPVWVAWMSVAEDGHIYGYGRDVTAEREQAEALRQAEDALRQSQKMEAVGQLTGGLAHDFNNLLTGISGSLDLLGRRLPRAAPTTSNATSTSPSRRRPARRGADAPPARLLAAADPRPQADRRGPAGGGHGGPDPADRGPGRRGRASSPAPTRGTRWCDPNQLENALLNLCINARDAMPDGGRLTVETANRAVDARRRRRAEPRARRLPRAQRLRHRHRHGPGRGGARLRPVLHHQAARVGHRARLVA